MTKNVPSAGFQHEQKYDIRQEYLGLVDGELEVIGRTVFAKAALRKVGKNYER